MKHTAFAAAAAAIAFSPLSAAEIDGVAAEVGGHMILKSDVVFEMRRLGFGPERYGEALNSLVERRLAVDAAGKAKMSVQDWVAENRIREIVDNVYGGDRNNLTAALARDKIPYAEWEKRVKEDIIAAAMRWNMVECHVRATPSEMRAEYEANRQKYSSGGTVTVGVILLKPEDVHLKETVDAELKTNSFENAARAYSADSHAADGGLWKDVVPGEVFQDVVVEELENMPVGTLSRWIDVSGWSFLLRKIDEKGRKTMSFAEAYPKIEAEVKKRNRDRLYKEWIDRLKAETYINIK